MSDLHFGAPKHGWPTFAPDGRRLDEAVDDTDLAAMLDDLEEAELDD